MKLIALLLITFQIIHHYELTLVDLSKLELEEIQRDQNAEHTTRNPDLSPFIQNKKKASYHKNKINCHVYFIKVFTALFFMVFGRFLKQCMLSNLRFVHRLIM